MIVQVRRLAVRERELAALRCAEPAVAGAAAAHAGRALSGPVEVFAELRAWKNVF